ncbi:MAG TPA: hybrid sensor histidine kinase/response regulator [Anaerolineales bacterium]|nr:hybrid sensor histidine kinase/response regulator [Anaerolineales bacterium]
MFNPKKTILVIDDEFHLLVGIKAILEREGYKAITINDSCCAVQKAREQHPDLILCDIMMPFMDGYRVRESLNEDAQTKDIPFLFLSARATQSDKLRGLKMGADDYITKPFDHHELLARIHAVLSRYEKGQADMQKKMEEQILRLQQEISHNISHELRTPMTQILLALDLVLRNKNEHSDELEQFVEIALSQSHRLNSIIDDLIFLSNYDRGAISTFRQYINIETDFLEIIKIRQEIYISKNLNVQVAVSPGIVIHAPRREFRQAIGHLVDNAFKFSAPMSAVQIQIEAKGEGGFVLTVKDHGVGIPVDLHEKIFERFFQVSQGDRREYNGLGVGLTIARLVSQSMGGDTIILPSESGCKVRMTVPPGKLDLI